MYNNQTDKLEATITIRLAVPGDDEALRRLAERDSASVPGGRILLATSGDEIRAALPVAGGAAIADPFHPTEEIVGLLRERARQLRGEPRGLSGRLAALVRRPRGFSPQPAGTLLPRD